MNFIVEVLPKKENVKEFVYVVRANNGFPLSVCDTLDEARNVIASKIEAFQKDAKILDNA